MPSPQLRAWQHFFPRQQKKLHRPRCRANLSSLSKNYIKQSCIFSLGSPNSFRLIGIIPPLNPNILKLDLTFAESWCIFPPFNHSKKKGEVLKSEVSDSWKFMFLKNTYPFKSAYIPFFFNFQTALALWLKYVFPILHCLSKIMSTFFFTSFYKHFWGKFYEQLEQVLLLGEKASCWNHIQNE